VIFQLNGTDCTGSKDRIFVTKPDLGVAYKQAVSDESSNPSPDYRMPDMLHITE
jgi:hypothetical protein